MRPLTFRIEECATAEGPLYFLDQCENGRWKNLRQSRSRAALEEERAGLEAIERKRARRAAVRRRAV